MKSNKNGNKTERTKNIVSYKHKNKKITTKQAEEKIKYGTITLGFVLPAQEVLLGQLPCVPAAR